jgi:hypothetical protein
LFLHIVELLLLFVDRVVQFLDGPVLQGNQTLKPFKAVFHGYPPTRRMTWPETVSDTRRMGA